MVEHLAVNEMVLGSSPSSGAKERAWVLYPGFFFVPGHGSNLSLRRSEIRAGNAIGFAFLHIIHMNAVRPSYEEDEEDEEPYERRP